MSSVPKSTPFSLNCTPATPTLSDADAVIVAVPVRVDPAEGVVMDTVGWVLSVTELLTVTDRDVEVVVLPAASRATARRVCVPLAVAPVFQLMENGNVVSADPRLAPSRVNWTLATPTLSDAVAETVTVPLTVAPEAGALRLTEGLVVSATLFTVTVRDADVVTLPAASAATARST